MKIPSLIFVIPTLFFASLSQQKPEPQQNTDNLTMGFTAQVNEINKARETAELYVKRLNLKYPKETSSNSQNCSDLYDTAYAAYNGWVDSVSLAIQMGKAKNLPKDKEYKGIATQANSAEQAFISCAKNALKKPEISSEGLPHLADANKTKSGPAKTKSGGGQTQPPDKIVDWVKKGVAVWQIVSGAIDKRRMELAKIFESGVKWKSWEEIIKPGP
jgi:hypothetical protein